MGKIYEEYIQQVYAYSLSLVKNRQVAEDISHEVFLKIWKKADSFVFGKNPAAWIMSIVHNTAMDTLRKSSHEGACEKIPEPATEIDPEAVVVERDSIGQLMHALKDNEAQIVLLHVMSGLTFASISRMLSLPMGTVAWAYRNAMKKLKNKLNTERTEWL